MTSLISFDNDRLKRAIVRFLRDKERTGGRPSIKRSVLQRNLTKFLGLEADLGSTARKEVDAKLNRAIAALRREAKPKIRPDKGDEIIRLVTKRRSKASLSDNGASV